MNKKLLQQTLGCLKIAKEDADSHFIVSKQDSEIFGYVIADLEKELAKPEQEPVSHLWECIGRWSAYLATNGKQGNLAPPEWLVDAVKAATSPPRKEWVGLTEHEIWECQKPGLSDDVYKLIEAKLKELNG